MTEAARGVGVVDPAVHQVGGSAPGSRRGTASMPSGMRYSPSSVVRHCSGAPEHQPQLHVAQVVPARPGQRPSTGTFSCCLQPWKPQGLVRPAAQPTQAEPAGVPGPGPGPGAASPGTACRPSSRDPVQLRSRPRPGAEIGSASKPGGLAPLRAPPKPWPSGALSGVLPTEEQGGLLSEARRAREARFRLEVRVGGRLDQGMLQTHQQQSRAQNFSPPCICEGAL